MSETGSRGQPGKLTTAQLTSARASTHGDFALGSAFTQRVMEMAMTSPSWVLMSDVQREGFHMIVHKMQRIVTGNPNHPDHWEDVAGYAMRVRGYIKDDTDGKDS